MFYYYCHYSFCCYNSNYIIRIWKRNKKLKFVIVIALGFNCRSAIIGGNTVVLVENCPGELSWGQLPGGNCPWKEAVNCPRYGLSGGNCPRWELPRGKLSQNRPENFRKFPGKHLHLLHHIAYLRDNLRN